jgi:multidrug efflux pump subunit AcrB
MILGAVLAFLVLILFLRDPRYPVAISLAIPISVITTFALFHAFGVSINIMSLGGLALGIGMLVDNSIVVIENIFRHREKGLRAAAAAALGAEEVQRAITASTLTTIAVFGPIIYVEGVAGELFASLSFAVAFSLLASLLVAVTLLPTMAARWGSARRRTRTVFWRPGLAGRPLDAFDRAGSGSPRFYHRSLDGRCATADASCSRRCCCSRHHPLRAERCRAACCPTWTRASSAAPRAAARHAARGDGGARRARSSDHP